MQQFSADLLYTFALAGFAAALVVWFRYTEIQARIISLLFAASAICTFSYGLEISLPSVEEKFWMTCVYYACIGVVLILSEFYVCYITRYPNPMRHWLVISTISLTIIFQIACCTTASHHLVFRKVWIDTSQIFPILMETYAILFWIYQAFIILASGYLIHIIFIKSWIESSLYRKQGMIIAGGLAIPVIFQVFSLTSWRLFGVINLQPFSYLLATSILTIGIIRSGLADIRPIARTLLVECMQDGVVVTDPKFIIVDINPAAKRMLQKNERESIGKPICQSLPILPKYSIECDLKTLQNKIFQLSDKICQISVNPLLDRNAMEIGYLIILRDISDQVRAEQLFRAQLEQNIASQERQKISRNLHDSVTQSLQSVMLFADTARQLLSERKIHRLISILELTSSSAHQAMKELRLLLFELRLEMEEDDFSLVETLQERLRSVEGRTGIRVSFNAPGKLHLTTKEQKETYYILTEALNNALKYANASEVRIRMKQNSMRFTAMIADNGCGFDVKSVASGCMGIENMVARAMTISGHLMISSKEKRGTKILLVRSYN